MDEGDWLAARFEEQRSRLRAVALRMLGSGAEADDAVQNTWLRLERADASGVDNLAGWLTTVLSRECLKLLRARRTRPEQPLVESSPEPAEVAGDGSAPEAEALLADSVGPALMIVLDTLAPAERLAFVLHDIFAVPFDEIAAILQRSPVATRQLASRARRRVQGATPPEPVDVARQRDVVDAFLAALRHGDFDGLVSVLDPDVVLLRADRTAPPGRSRVVLNGAGAVAAHARRFSAGARFAHPALVNGVPGVALVLRGRVVGALGFTYKQARIAQISEISGRQRLRHVELTAPR